MSYICFLSQKVKIEDKEKNAKDTPGNLRVSETGLKRVTAVFIQVRYRGCVGGFPSRGENPPHPPLNPYLICLKKAGYSSYSRRHDS
jgi:hypothetical protein